MLWLSCLLVTVSVMWIFLTRSWVPLQGVIVVLPDLTHLLLQIFQLSIRDKPNSIATASKHCNDLKPFDTILRENTML